MKSHNVLLTCAIAEDGPQGRLYKVPHLLVFFILIAPFPLPSSSDLVMQLCLCLLQSSVAIACLQMTLMISTVASFEWLS